MTELGEHLKSTREQQKLSLDDIQELTKIQKRYLQSIEEGQFQQLPGPFYTKAFVKSYAEAVGLDPDALFKDYGDELPKISQTVESLPPRRSRTSISTSRRKLWSSLPGLLVLILVIGLFAVIWVAIQGNDEELPNRAVDNDKNVEFQSNEDAVPNNEDQEDSTDSSDTADDSSNQENQQPTASEEQITEQQDGELELIDKNGDTSNFTLKGTDQFNVIFTFTGESWLKIEGDSGKMYVNDGFSKGEESTFDFSDESGVRIRIGSTPNMSMSINGEEAALEPNPVAQTVRVIFE